MRKYRLASWLAVVCLIAVLAAGCGTKPEPAAASGIELNVSAALGLKEALLDIQKEYEGKNPNITLVYNLAAAGVLQAQIERGVPADIFISAARKQMDDLQKKGRIADATRRDLVGNKLVLVIHKDSDLGLTSFRDLTDEKVVRYGLGTPETMPAGQYGIEVLKYLGIWDKVKGKAVLAKDIRQIIAYVETKNVDAGIVFSTVAALSDKVRVVAAAPPGSHRPIVFPGAVLKDAKHPREAEAFLNYLSGPEAARIFQKYGFSVISR
ncbi:molybdate ABC transporter substrate-binding protein [Anaeroselena agilis]|uniref:Molybdate ABC transporter substrate-binding protein n=1 Tax=Anaeroselena agilis TaxID=3063788 RepID=A0ABU3NZF0_9FIRM|nr:molybdate ABC transporter substrate-binding protein [Selenomonadales bacterium 4137-cl]